MAEKMLYDLVPGDRFYFVGDPKKAIREIKEVVKKGRHITKEVTDFVIYTDLKEGHSNRPVIFLRNSND
jgi:hypothetical protein